MPKKELQVGESGLSPHNTLRNSDEQDVEGLIDLRYAGGPRSRACRPGIGVVLEVHHYDRAIRAKCDKIGEVAR